MIRGFRLAAALGAAAVISGAAVAPSASAATANSGIYASAPQWGGFCPNAGQLKNYPTWVSYINYTTGRQGGDSRDDIVWIPVANGVPNQIQVNVTCRWSTPIGGIATITPTRYGQTWWFSVWGQTWHN